jgi:hypothetical protein
MIYTIKYQAGTYSGIRTISANDEEEAIAKVRAKVRREMTLPMYSDSYKIIDTIGDEECGDDN